MVNLNEYFEEVFSSNDATRWNHLKMENIDLVSHNNSASNRSLNEI